MRPQTTEEGGCSCQHAEGFPDSLALPCTQPAWLRESRGLGSPWHCQLDQKVPWSQLLAPLPAWLVSPLAAGWVSVSARLRNCHDFIPLNTEIAQRPVLASHFQAQICFAIIRLSYRASTIKPIPAHPTQPPPQILQAPQSYLKGEKKGPVRWSGWRRGGVRFTSEWR